MYDLGLTSDEVWKLTPAQYSALMGRHKNARVSDDYRFGIVASVMAATVGGKASPEDFFSSVSEAMDILRAEEARDRNTEELLSAAMAFTTQVSGTVSLPEGLRFKDAN